MPPTPRGPDLGRLFIRRLPDSVVPEIPLPAGARLWGSQLRHLAGRAASMEAVLDVDAEPSALLDAYEDELRRAGWSAFEGFGPPHGGFVGAEMGDGRVLQQGGAGPVLAVSAVARQGAPTDMRIRLDWEMALRPPSGVAMRGLSGSGGNGRWTSETTLETDRPVPELETHFIS